MSTPLEPDAQQRAELNEQADRFLEEWYSRVETMNASGEPLTDRQISDLMEPPREQGRDFARILDDLDLAGQAGILHPSSGHMSYIPNGGLYTGAIAEQLAAGLNRYTGVAGAAPGMTAIETGVTQWVAGLFGMGESAAAILLSGGSTANLTGIVAARVNRLGDHFDDGVIYLTAHTHHSVAKAARIAGFRNDQIRIVPVDADLRMRVDVMEEMVTQDTESGLRPFLVVASAGTTDTGTVDDLEAIGAVAKRHELWMHTDAAYGGFFVLTERGRKALAGIGESDSVAVDPHKGLSIPFGVGALVVRDQNYLLDANYGRGAYLNHEEVTQGLRDISSLGPELSRPFRGLSVWLPLQLHGVAPFRKALDDALDVAEHGYERVRQLDGIRANWKPDLSIVAFGFEDDTVGREAMRRVNEDRVTHISSTEVEGRFILRLAVLNRRTTIEDVDHAIDMIQKALIG
ncbi:MAG: aminotransferase class V-fold PLP-dependent enzyme [Actinobacteria bacterium]|nr:MAG: aminotransferase class V-fold PLP-dependent enzyme [Actinomycetota bacterium]